MLPHLQVSSKTVQINAGFYDYLPSLFRAYRPIVLIPLAVSHKIGNITLLEVYLLPISSNPLHIYLIIIRELYREIERRRLKRLISY